jgi:Fe-Mn family superoxide dismutase
MEDNTMETQKLYVLPQLPYDYTALAPHMSEEVLRFHHDKHHASYVTGANTILQMMDKMRSDGGEFDTKAVYKELSFHIGGHVLHSLFWENLAPANQGGGGQPSGKLEQIIKEEYGSFERFKTLFSAAAKTAEGSGWAALSYCTKTNRPLIMQIEKHNLNLYPSFGILMVLDVWEHAYYLDYKNERAKFVEGFWNVVNWQEVGKRLERHLTKHSTDEHLTSRSA